MKYFLCEAQASVVLPTAGSMEPEDGASSGAASRGAGMPSSSSGGAPTAAASSGGARTATASGASGAGGSASGAGGAGGSPAEEGLLASGGTYQDHLRAVFGLSSEEEDEAATGLVSPEGKPKSRCACFLHATYDAYIF